MLADRRLKAGLVGQLHQSVVEGGCQLARLGDERIRSPPRPAAGCCGRPADGRRAGPAAVVRDRSRSSARLWRRSLRWGSSRTKPTSISPVQQGVELGLGIHLAQLRGARSGATWPITQQDAAAARGETRPTRYMPAATGRCGPRPRRQPGVRASSALARIWRAWSRKMRPGSVSAT